MSLYSITEKIAYSKAGKMVATLLRNQFYPNCRIHWIQDAIATFNFSRLS